MESTGFLQDDTGNRRFWVIPASPKAAAEELTSELILTQAVGKPTERQTRADQMQVAAIMRELGYAKERRRINNTLRWVFQRP
jgi:hypothetical protein